MPAASTLLAVDEQLRGLAEGPLHPFAEWAALKREVPASGFGIYSVWRDGRALMYVGIGGWSASAPAGRGLLSRLNSHASGQRSGDKFCIYVCDRLVLPQLSRGQLEEVAGGRLALDRLTREYVREHFAFRFVAVRSIERAREVEAAVKGGALGEPPFLQVPAGA